MKIILQAADVSSALSAFLLENYNITVAPEAINLDIDEVVVEVNPITETNTVDEAPIKRTRNRSAKGSSTPVVVADDKTDTSSAKGAELTSKVQEHVQSEPEPTAEAKDSNPFTDDDVAESTTPTEEVEAVDVEESGSIFD